MAAASHVSATIYGQIQGNIPFQNAAGNAAFSKVSPYPNPPLMSLPVNAIFTPLHNGVLVGTNYVYSVITMPATGNNTYGLQFVTDVSTATLATNAG